jgi:hypothetical protein
MKTVVYVLSLALHWKLHVGTNLFKVCEWIWLILQISLGALGCTQGSSVSSMRDIGICESYLGTVFSY